MPGGRVGGTPGGGGGITVRTGGPTGPENGIPGGGSPGLVVIGPGPENGTPGGGKPGRGPGPIMPGGGSGNCPMEPKF